MGGRPSCATRRSWISSRCRGSGPRLRSGWRWRSASSTARRPSSGPASGSASAGPTWPGCRRWRACCGNRSEPSRSGTPVSRTTSATSRSACGRRSIDLIVARAGPVATLTLNRPERRNALDGGLLSELIATLTALNDDPSARVVVLTGAPPVFSSGADQGRGSAASPPPGQFIRLFSRLATVLERLELPVIAALNGHAVGGGWVLALCCDFRFAAEAAQCWIPEVDMGIALHPVLTTPFG